MRFGFVDSENPRAALAAQGSQRNGGPEAVFHRRGIGEMAEEGFSRNTEKNRTTQRREGFQTREEREVVRGGFSKTDSWVEGDAHRVEAGRYCPLEGVSKKIPNLGDHIIVGRS